MGFVGFFKNKKPKKPPETSFTFTLPVTFDSVNLSCVSSQPSAPQAEPQPF